MGADMKIHYANDSTLGFWRDRCSISDVIWAVVQEGEEVLRKWSRGSRNQTGLTTLCMAFSPPSTLSMISGPGGPHVTPWAGISASSDVSRLVFQDVASQHQ